MVVLIFIFLSVIVSIGLVLCATVLRSKSLSILNLCIWLVATFVVTPWYTLTSAPPLESDARLEWDAALIWAVFFAIAILTLIYCAIAVRMVNRLPKHRRRRRSRSENPVVVTPEATAKSPRRSRNSRMSEQNI